MTLQSPELASSSVQPWTARLRYAYADALLAAGREDEAREWFGKALEADKDGATDASDRLAELDGVEFVDASVDPADEDADDDRAEDEDDDRDRDFDEDEDDEDDDEQDAAEVAAAERATDVTEYYDEDDEEYEPLDESAGDTDAQDRKA